MMPIFEALGRRVETAWQAANYDELAFPAIAAEALRGAQIPTQIGIEEVLEWLFAAQVLPEQDDLEAKFGEPPITVYCGRRFYVQVLFWLTSSTSIHRHAFTGAFQVLAGSSLHSRYEFHPRQRVCSQLFLGDVRFRAAELLRRGDIVEITRDLAHGLFHLDAPSATVVIRTAAEPEAQPQLEYRPPCIAVDSFYEEPILARWVQALDLLHRAGNPRYADFAMQLLERTDLYTAYLVLQHAYRRLDKLDDTVPLLRAAERRHGAAIAELSAALLEERRRYRIYRLRTSVRDPERRFFLALVLNLPDRDSIYAMIRARYPDEDPRERVIAWTRALSGVDVIGIDLQDELLQLLFAALLDGCSTAETLERLRAEYDASEIESNAAAIERQLTRLQHTALAPLFHRA